MAWMREHYINPDHRKAKTIGRPAQKARLPHAGSVDKTDSKAVLREVCVFVEARGERGASSKASLHLNHH